MTLQAQDRQAKIDAIIEEIINAVSSSCNCPLLASDFSDSDFTCPSEATQVIFRSRVFTVLPATSDSIVSNIQTWVSTAPDISVQSETLTVDPSCVTAISSFSDDICPAAQIEIEEKPDVGKIVGVVVGVVVGLVVLVIVVILAIVIFCKWRRTKRYKIG